MVGGKQRATKRRRRPPPPAPDLVVTACFSPRTTRLAAALTARGVHLYTADGGLRFAVDDTPAFQVLRHTQLWANAQREVAALYALTAFFEGCPEPEDGELLQ